jgi:hypothetical protein
MTDTDCMTEHEGTLSKDGSTIYRHLDYELQCSAKPVDNGRFAPNLVVCKQVWPTRPRAIAVQRGEHLTERTAIEAAYHQGVDWVKNYG